MKTANYFRTGIFLLAITGLALTSCKKDKLEEGSNDATSLKQLSTDETAVDEISDNAMMDVESFLWSEQGGLKSTENLPCHATIDSVVVANDTVTKYITYNGLSCNGRRLITGNVEIRRKVGEFWIMPNSSVNIRLINYSVTRVASGQTIVINSNKTFTNVSGGFVFELGYNPLVTSVVHRVSGTDAIAFGNGTVRTWHVARQRTYTGTQGELMLAVDGFGSSGDYNNLVTWGTNRNGEEFYTQISQTVVFRQTCDWDPVSGIKIHNIPASEKSATVTFGYNSNYEPITGDECPTYYRVDWQNGTYTGTSYLPLP